MNKQQLSIGQLIGVRLVRTISALVFGYLAFTKRAIKVDKTVHRYGPKRCEALDHLYPASEPRTGEAIVYIHGGGFISCGRKYYPRDLQFLCDAGFPVFNVGYPRAPEHPHPYLLQSILRAVAWIKTHRPEIKRVHMMGDSAGANLAAMYAVLYSNPELLPTLAGEFSVEDLLEPASVVSLYGLLDRDTLMPDGAENMKGAPKLFLQAYGGLPVLQPGPVTPEHAITPLDMNWSAHPPCFIAVGDIDFLLASSERYAQELAKRDVRMSFKTYPGAPHGFFNFSHEQTPVLRRDVLEFLNSLG